MGVSGLPRRLVRKIISRPLPNIFQNVYDNFDQALADSAGYENSDLVHVIVEKTKAYRRHLDGQAGVPLATRQQVQNAFVLSYLSGILARPVDVLDLGGACGATFFEMDKLLPGFIGSWSILETAHMAAAGRQYFAADRLRFYEDSGRANGEIAHRDLIFASAVLQYLPDPIQTLRELTGAGYRYVYLTRMKFTTGVKQAYVSKQTSTLSANGPGTLPAGIADKTISYPVTILPVAALDSIMAESGYSTLFYFEDSPPEQILLGDKRLSAVPSSYLFEKV